MVQISEKDSDDENTNAAQHQEHETINLDEIKEVVIRAAVSGRTTISRYYKEPGKEAQRRIAETDISKHLESLPTQPEWAQEETIRLATKYYIYAKNRQ